MRRIETASLHRGIAGSQHSFLPVPPGSNKMQQLLQVRCPQPKLVRNVVPVKSCSATEGFGLSAAYLPII